MEATFIYTKAPQNGAEFPKEMRDKVVRSVEVAAIPHTSSDSVVERHRTSRDRPRNCNGSHSVWSKDRPTRTPKSHVFLREQWERACHLWRARCLNRSSVISSG